MDTQLTTALLIALFMAYKLVHFALQRKGDVRAGASIGNSSFYLEVKERTSRSPAHTHQSVVQSYGEPSAQDDENGADLARTLSG